MRLFYGDLPFYAENIYMHYSNIRIRHNQYIIHTEFHNELFKYDKIRSLESNEIKVTQ